MDWLRAHPLLDATVSAGALLIVGALFVRTQIAPPVQVSDGSTWGNTSGVYVDTVSRQGSSLAQQAYSGPGPQAQDIGIIPLQTQNAIGTGPSDQSDGFDIAALAAFLSNPASASSQTGDIDTGGAYDFIPGGLIATTTLASPRTQLQNDLYYYGNDVGDAITSFELLHPNQPETLKNHATQPDNPTAAAALQKLGDDYASLGDSIGKIDPVPKEARAAHTALIDAYRALGAKLSAVSQAHGDEALFDAIVAYNASADEFAKKFVSLALLFQAYSVTFSPGDGGSVFVFPSSGL